MRLEERVNTYGTYLKRKYGRRVFRVGVTTGFQCMHREMSGGCVFCLPETFTDEEEDIADKSWEDRVTGQLDTMIAKVKKGIGIASNEAGAFLGYYQIGFPAAIGLEQLRRIYETTLHHKEIVGLIVSARPDEIDDQVMTLLSQLPGDVYLELGMQSVNDRSLEFLGRSQSSSDMDRALELCKKYSLPAGVHLILGIPGETISDIMATIDYVNRREEIREVKLHNLVVYQGTVLSGYPQEVLGSIPGLEEYLKLLGTVIAHLRKDIVISRFFTSNVKGNNTALNPFSGIKREWLNRLTGYLNDNNIIQGMSYRKTG